MEPTSVLENFIEEELYNSALLLAEYFYASTHSDIYIYYLLKTLQRLNYNERILSFIKGNVTLLKYIEIKKIYIVAVSKFKEIKVLEFPSEPINLKITKNNNFSLQKQSVTYFYEALTLKEESKTKQMIKSFKCDERNMEPLFYLRHDKLISKEAFRNLIKTITDESLRTIYTDVFFDNCYFQMQNASFKLVDEFLFFSPFQAYNLAMYFGKRSQYYEIFKLGIFMLDNYPSLYLSPMILGFYYIKKNNFLDAKKSLYESIEIDKTQGRSWYLLGITLSRLKERLNAINCFNKAKKFMTGSYKPKFHLAKEYSEIGDKLSAFYYYKSALKMKLNKKVIFYYLTFLFKEDKTKDMSKPLSMLQNFDLNFNEKNVYNLLKFFYLLSRGNFTEAENTIKICKMDWRYNVCYGYLKHLTAKNEEAANFYGECMLGNCEDTSIISQLIKLAQSGITQLNDHDLVDYSVDIFDMLQVTNVLDVNY